MEPTTKDRILDEALVCFAENGYKGTNLRDLAAQLGLSKSALYKHYTSKEDIWNALIDRMTRHYEEHFITPERMERIPATCRELLAFSLQMVNFTVHDSRVILMRKLLLTEQFRDEKARQLAAEHFLHGTKRTFTVIFRHMMQVGTLRQGDPEMLAFSFTAPITVLIHACDREPEKEPEYMAQVEAFVRHFIAVYGLN